ncbi:MAG TPA: hypothetical protein VFQ25_06730 [Ktedonobacterales bacterium]|nr:hypothetical protein [Ktedonobacterales bacterium]
MTGARSNGARKSMRAIPLTQRQRKSGKPESKASQRAQRRHDKPAGKASQVQRIQGKPEGVGVQRIRGVQSKPEGKAAQPQRAQAALPQGRRARAPRGGRPAPIPPRSRAPLATPSATPGVRPSAPLDLNAESGASRAPAPLMALAKKALSLVKRNAPPTAETHPMVMTPTPKTGEPLAADATPRRVRVRVRRKLPTPAPMAAAPERDMELAETSILAAPSSAPSRAAPESDTKLLSAEAVGVSPAVAKEAPAPFADASGADDAMAAETIAEGEFAPEAAPAEPAEAAPPEPRKPATTRKLPTLAVMAALATRAEARAESGALSGTLQEQEQDVNAPSALAAPETPEAPVVAEPPAGQEEASDGPASRASGMTEETSQAPEEPVTASTPEPGGASVTQPRGSRAMPASPPAEPVASAPIAPEAPSGSGMRRMWWLSQPELAGAARGELDELSGHDERDGLNGRNRRNGHDGRAGQDESERRDAPASRRAPRQTPPAPVEAASAPVAPVAPPVTQPRPRPAAPPIALPPAPRISPSIPRQPDHWREAARGVSRPHRARPSDARARMQEQERDAHAPLLVWTGGAQAALCGVAALVAALALLNGTAGERARVVFAWAMAFALIAGIGAGLGHLAWQMKRARLAPLALVISQLGLLAWSLALLGARPALMALAPFTAALALRALGRWAAALASLASLSLYGAALALNLMSAWTPIAAFEPIPAAALDAAILVAGMALTALALMRLYAVSERERARTRAIERAARLASLELESLRSQTEDDADALRRALSAALRGVPTEDMRAEGALSPLADQVGVVAQRLVELSHDREERKRLESAVRRLIRNIERAWLGLSWSWPEASGVILDDLVALLRTPPPSEPSQLPEKATPTGQLVAPHLYRAWQPGDSIPSQPLSPQPSLWPDRASPSQPSGVWPSLWPSDPEPGSPGTDPLALPPAPRWRGPDEGPRQPDSAIPWPGGANGSWPSRPSRPGW